MTITAPLAADTPVVIASAKPTSKRIDVVDALRGFALAGIMLLHNVEQFNFYHKPDQPWLTSLSASDPQVWDGLFFLFGGKAYAIFSMLFGFSFWVQFSRMKENGYDFGGRFMWRMVLLFGFGLIHSIYYSGDLLIFYATFGFSIVLFRKVSDRMVLIVSLCLLALPLDLYRLARMLFESGYLPPSDISWQFWGNLASAQGGGSFMDLVKADLTDGLKANITWTWESGRMFHIPGLFLLGMLASRRKVFTEMATRKWAWVLTLSFVVLIPLHFINKHMSEWVVNEALRNHINGIIWPYGDVVFLIFIVSAFILLWRAKIGEKLFGNLIPYGRMSLTNYMSQALICICIYYEFGLGMHHHAGATLGVIIGLGVLTAQVAASHWWLNHFKQGPLEMLWRKLMWLGSDKRIR